tara:strand:+ start:326 stop:775 length:450 start_codon:yes stop_codon:yes gene_type:complete
MTWYTKQTNIGNIEVSVSDIDLNTDNIESDLVVLHNKSPELLNANKAYFSSDVTALSDVQTQLIASGGAGTQVWVYGYEFHADAAGTYKLESSSTALTGVMPIGTNGGVARDATILDCPIYKCATNEAFNITTTTSRVYGSVNGFIVTI